MSRTRPTASSARCTPTPSATASWVPIRFAGLRIPVPTGRRKIVPLTEEEIVELADRALRVYDEPLGPTVRALIMVAGFAGLRPGELGGLEWDDVDLQGSRLHVRRSMAPDGSLKAPKNGEPRVCVLAPRARDALASLNRHADEPAVLLTPRNRRFGKGAIHRYFAPVRAAFGRPKLQFYELRHACATLLLERGLAPEDVAIQLGHTDGGSLVRQLLRPPVRGPGAGADRDGFQRGARETGRIVVAA